MTDSYPNILAIEAKREVCRCGHPQEEHGMGRCHAWVEPADEKEMGWYCKCEAYEYNADSELAWLRKQHTETLKFLNAFDECYKWCECDGGGHNEGPYFVECPTCQGHGMRVSDYRSLNTLHYHAASVLKTRWYHPDFRGFEEEEDQ